MKLFHFLRSLIGVLAIAHRNAAFLRLAIAHHQHVGDLLQLRFADLEVHFFFAIVQFDAQTGGLQLIDNLLRVLGLAIGNRHHHRLHRRQPHRKRARVVLDQNAEEALDRTVQRAMHHQAADASCRRRRRTRDRSAGAA